jgi:hypothetical protein
MSSKRNVYKCRFGCSDTFRTEEGRNYHEEMIHSVWITPTTSTTRQAFTLSHVFDWTRSTVRQLTVAQDKLNVDYCL